MIATEAAEGVRLDNILYLTDFSEASQEVVPFVDVIAHQYGSKLFGLPITT
jgi:hypothetical protein